MLDPFYLMVLRSPVVVAHNSGSCYHRLPRILSNSNQLLEKSSGYYIPARNLIRFPAEKPNASEVLTCHLENNGCPPWTSYFVRYDSIVNDQRGRSHFNWTVGKDGEKHNYHILRTGCYPYIKYHCSKRPYQDLRIEDAFFRFIKVFNLGLPCLAYGIAAIFLIKHEEKVITSKGTITIYFLYAENRGSSF